MTRGEFIHACMATGRWKLSDALREACELEADEDFPPFDEDEDEGGDELDALLAAVDKVVAAERAFDSKARELAIDELAQARAAFPGDDEDDPG